MNCQWWLEELKCMLLTHYSDGDRYDGEWRNDERVSRPPNLRYDYSYPRYSLFRV